MSLHIRLHINFWTHRKTMRLRAIIGDSALWVPPRLWCYAAEHQPDGDFSEYLPQEIAMLIDYPGDAQALLQALRQASFMDGMRLHGWDEHNSYHVAFSQRAKKAADARWTAEKEKKQKKEGEERKGKETSNASSIAKVCFEHFWHKYPRKIGKGKALSSWMKLTKEEMDLAIESIDPHIQSEQWKKEGGAFIPHPSTYLNQRRWEDEVEPVVTIKYHEPNPGCRDLRTQIMDGLRENYPGLLEELQCSH